MLLEKVKCPTCGAPVNIGSRDALARCSYCGGQFRIARDAYGAQLAADFLARAAAARWLEEQSTMLQVGRAAAEARHQREMWQFEREGALLSFWPLLFILALVLGLIFILVGGIGAFAGAALVASGVALSLLGWQAQNRLADHEERSARLFGETMAQFDRREAGIRRQRERILTQIEALIEIT